MVFIYESTLRHMSVGANLQYEITVLVSSYIVPNRSVIHICALIDNSYQKTIKSTNIKIMFLQTIYKNFDLS